ncbi:peptidylprolyl isomerase [Candidatus Berkelbacteria bacterium]|nr:peptidylprolyl isomerase [Candidatus Berkelbacteria bacterium]
MAGKRIDWPQIYHELRRRWFVLTLVGGYLLIGGLFAILIYGFGWDQQSTRWAAQLFPLPAARVNGETIWLSTYYRRVGIFEHYADVVKTEQPDLFQEDSFETRQQTIDQLVDMLLLRQEAATAGITVTNEEIMLSYQKVAAARGGDEAFALVIDKLYGLTPFQFAQEFVPEQLYQEKLQNQLFTQVHARYIVNKDEKLAGEALEKVKQGTDFGEVAKQYSQDITSREQGGDLGWIRRGQIAKPFEDAAFSLAVGTVTNDLVKTDFGFAILKVDERKEGTISDQSFGDWLEAVKTKAIVKRYVPKEAPAETETPSPAPTDSPSETPAASPSA